MELQIRTDPDALYQIVAPIYFNNDVVGVLDGKHSQGRVGRRALMGFRIDRRTSFKHPVIGFVIGFVLVAIPLQALMGDPLGLWWVTLASPLRLVGSFFLFSFGIYLLWGVVSRREMPWLVLITDSGERAFPLRDEMPENAVAALRALITENEAEPAKQSPQPVVAAEMT